MNFEILNIAPKSGEFIEKHFGENFNSTLWVKFTDNNYRSWVGCFSKSTLDFSTVLIDENNLKSFIVAGGKGYLIDLSERKIITEIDEQPLIESAIRTKKPEYFIAGTFTSIYVIENNGIIKEIKPNEMIDGIYFKKQYENKAIGELASARNQYERNVYFEFDLYSFEVTINYKRKIKLE